MSEETKVELGLKEVLAECLEALKAIEGFEADNLRTFQQAHDHYRAGSDAYRRAAPTMMDHADASQKKLARIRAALAVVELWEAVEVTTQEQARGLQTRIFAEARRTNAPTAHAASLLHVWQPEDHDQAEVEAIAHLAAALECRRRNGEA